MAKWLAALIQTFEDIWNEIKGSKIYRNVVGLFGLVGAGLGGINYFRPDFVTRIHSLRFGSVLTWQSWVMAFLILVSIATADGARRLIEKQKKNYLTTIEPTLQALISLV